MKDINPQDLGSIKIHRRVLAGIVESSLKDIEGVYLPKPNFLASVSDLLGVKIYPGISTNVDKNNQVNIEVKVTIGQGVNVPDVARAAQDAIRLAIEKTVDVDLKDINVNIQGIERRRG